MTATSARQASSGPPRALRMRRGGIALGAVLAAVLVWLIAGPLLDERLRITQDSGQRTLEIGLFPVVVLSLVSALADWALLAALERFTRRVCTVWVSASLAVLVLSFLPLTGPGMTGGTRASLALMHLAVAAVLIPGLAATIGRPELRARSEQPADAA
jgi:hypothetical protein